MEKSKEKIHLPSIDECIKNNDIINLKQWETYLNNKKDKLSKKMQLCSDKFHAYQYDNKWDHFSKKNSFALAGSLCTIPTLILTFFINGFNVAAFFTIFFLTGMLACFGVTGYYYVKNNIAMNRLYSKINQLQNDRIVTISELEKIENIIHEEKVVEHNPITPEQFFEENKDLIFYFMQQKKHSAPIAPTILITPKNDQQMNQDIESESSDDNEESPE